MNVNEGSKKERIDFEREREREMNPTKGRVNYASGSVYLFIFLF